LSEQNCKSIFIPKGFAHGFLGIDKENIIVYGNSNYRSKNNEIGLMWNDKNLAINWPNKKFIISKKDRNNLSFKEFVNQKINL
jgi:dTDP-4-dehydrorhamnose 3,5-epimerase